VDNWSEKTAVVTLINTKKNKLFVAYTGNSGARAIVMRQGKVFFDTGANHRRDKNLEKKLNFYVKKDDILENDILVFSPNRLWNSMGSEEIEKYLHDKFNEQNQGRRTESDEAYREEEVGDNVWILIVKCGLLIARRAAIKALNRSLSNYITSKRFLRSG